MNILVCTPGRLLQHITETYNFNLASVQVFVMDEADLLLEMGFLASVKRIIQELPKDCQRMLFSATLGKKIHNLATLALKNPENIFLHDTEAAKNIKNTGDIFETPQNLMQYYMVIKEDQKVNNLFSFLKAHLKSKVLVFVSTCKQVRFLYESFKIFKIGTPVFEIHGRMKQKKRMAVFYTFAEKQFGCLFTTNLASRGLDIPQVTWVLQLDCPEDTNTYIHRIGRTARHKQEGKALILLTSYEEKFAENLKNLNINVHKIHQNPQKSMSISNSLMANNSENPDLKYLAQRAFISYIKFLNQNTFFDVQKVNLKVLAESYGLVQTPSIEIIINTKDDEGKSKIQKMREKEKQKKLQKKLLREGQLENQQENTLEVQKVSEMAQENDSESEDDFIMVKRKPEEVKIEKEFANELISKRQLNKVKEEGHFQGKNKTFFKDGVKYTEQEWRNLQLNDKKQNVDVNQDKTAFFQQRVMQNREQDKVDDKARRQEKKIKKKQKMQEEQGEQVELESQSDEERDNSAQQDNDDNVQE